VGNNKNFQDVVDAVERMWRAGKSDRQIVDWFASRGRPMTRNSIIGIRNRRGWIGRVAAAGFSYSKQVAKPKKLVKESKRRLPVLNSRYAAGALPTPAEFEEITMPAVVGQVLFADLRYDQCRWPDGAALDPVTIDTPFCGAPRVGGHPYCHDHCRVAYPKFK
jgi:GcrA cell cycle regulator